MRIVRARFVKANDDDRVPGHLVQVSAADERLKNIVLKPPVGDGAGRQSAVIRVVTKIRRDEGIAWQGIVRQIVRKTKIGILEGDESRRAIALYVAEIRNRSMPGRILPVVTAKITRARQTFRIAFPCFSSGQDFPDDVVSAEAKSASRRHATIIVRRNQ